MRAAAIVCALVAQSTADDRTLRSGGVQRSTIRVAFIP